MQSTTRQLFTTLTLGLLAGATSAQAIAGPAPRPRPKPTNFKALPDYSTGLIELSWDDLTNETGYEILKAEYGMPLTVVATVGRNVSRWQDIAVTTEAEYVYAVKALYGARKSNRTKSQRQNLKSLWPAPDTHEVLHGWNDTLGTAGQWKRGFHLGIDIQRSASDNEVIAARGGVVIKRNDGANGLIDIRFKEGARRYVVQTNHISEITVDVDDVVYAGQKIGEISETYFSTDWVDHTHFMLLNKNRTVHRRHPLTIFSAPSDVDPGGTMPDLVSHPGSSGMILYKRQGGAGYLTVDEMHPLDGDVDIIVNLADAMGTNPDQIPVLIAYWIEPPVPGACGAMPHSVRDGSSPYVLINTVNACYSCGLSEAAGIALGEAIADKDQNYGSSISEDMVPYPWPNYKHYILTNTKGSNGKRGNIDAGQYWNTNAKDDGAGVLTAHSNYAGKTDTLKASEARFPDGDYKVHVNAADLINNNAGIEFPVRLENYPPIVCMTDPAPGETFPAGTDEVANLTVVFNEPMDMGVPAHTILHIDAGATLHDQVWVNPFTIKFTAKDMVNGTTYTLRVIAAAAKDRPGTPGGRMLDGNDNGFGGDDYTTTFSIGS